MDIETGYEPVQQASAQQSDNPPMLEINDPTTKLIPQNEPSHSRGGKYNLRPNPNPKYLELYRYWREQKFIPAPSVCLSSSLILLFSNTHIIQLFLFSILKGKPILKLYINKSNSTLTNTI